MARRRRKLISETLLEAMELTKYFKTPKGQLHALDHVSFALTRGKTLGVVGESGCGKSTLGRTVLRLLEPTSGAIYFEGVDIATASKSHIKNLRREMQIIFQDPYSSLDPRKTVYDTIAEPIKLNTSMKRAEIVDRVFELMDTVGLAYRFAYSYPHEMDGGRRQRIGIARAISLNPKFLVCDEPVSALDVSIQAQILNLLMDLQKEKSLTYMFISHDLSVVKHISDDIMIMYMGECVEKAPRDEIFENPRHPYTKALLAAILRPNLKNKGVIRTVVKGEVSSPIEPAPGCRFAPRCPMAKPECTVTSVPLKKFTEKHVVACINES
jgi:peptide/nickel transport system ATP-binding protein